MNKVILQAIFFVHICIILFVVIVPFTNSPFLLMMHSIFVPFILFHWLTNNDTCVLTLTEKYLKNIKTKKDEDDCFTCRLINPIFNFHMTAENSTGELYMIVVVLWVICMLKLCVKVQNDEIANIRDFYTIISKY